MTQAQETKHEFTGKTLADCLSAAAEQFGVKTEQLDVEVLEKPGSIKALFGKKARIRAAVKGKSLADKIADGLRFDSAPLDGSPLDGSPLDGDAPDKRRKSSRPMPIIPGNFNPTEALARIVTTIVPETTIGVSETDDQLILDIEGDGSGIFIGRKGSTLEAIQFLMGRMSQKQGWDGKRIIIDSEGYRERRVDVLRSKVRHLAERVQGERKAMRTELLDASMRKVVHSEIKAYAELGTRSIGNGELKRVQIHLADESDSRGRQQGRPRR